MENEDRRFLLMGAGLVGMGLAGVAAAGSLNPPVGPVAPTGKPLTDIEPRIAVQSLAGDANSVHLINQPGSYYLTGNISGVSPRDGIRITASDVSIDLCGFAISGPGSGSGTGINQTAGVRARIRNGFVSSFPSGAIKVNATAVVSDMVASSGSFGISAGDQSRVERCTAQLAGTGILVLTDCTVTGCRVDGNVTNGISAGAGSRVSGCEVSGGATNGIVMNGVVSGSPSVVRDCVVYGAGDGIEMNPAGSVAEGNTVNNCSTGIRMAATQSRVALNHLSACTNGIVVTGAVSLVVQNTIYGSSTPMSLSAGTQSGPVVSAAGIIAVGTSPWANFTS